MEYKYFAEPFTSESTPLDQCRRVKKMYRKINSGPEAPRQMSFTANYSTH